MVSLDMEEVELSTGEKTAAGGGEERQRSLKSGVM